MIRTQGTGKAQNSFPDHPERKTQGYLGAAPAAIGLCQWRWFRGSETARWSLKNDVVIVGYEVKPAAMFVERTRADKLDLRRYRRQARCFPDLMEPVRSLASAIFSR